MQERGLDWKLNFCHGNFKIIYASHNFGAHCQFPEIFFILLFASILKEFMSSIFNLHNTKARLFLKIVKILQRRKSLSKDHTM